MKRTPLIIVLAIVLFAVCVIFLITLLGDQETLEANAAKWQEHEKKTSEEIISEEMKKVWESRDRQCSLCGGESENPGYWVLVDGPDSGEWNITCEFCQGGGSADEITEDN